ncbi:helix-turn-helix domain-containing protein [Bacillus sp. UNC322MFChir4.1]|uniref:helix-turn-helix domain-containing protein n=1 Tax=Bacillus sp. UNC322MFChir4.1 TaxID=1449045 RepID=UPI0005536052|nr:helix-turn-helix domain-containing protein [Bacillus sp. UNC322MFChir4.1]
MDIDVDKTKLKMAFEKSGYTYEELAKNLGISCSYCYKIINNEKYKKKIYYSLASKISHELKSDIKELFDEQVNFF